MTLGKIIDKKNNDLSKRIDKQKVPEHIAIIMDGNGRWATKQGLPRTYGHRKGVDVLKEILKASKKLFTKSFNKIKAKTNIIKIAKKIFFTFICL